YFRGSSRARESFQCGVVVAIRRNSDHNPTLERFNRAGMEAEEEAEGSAALVAGLIFAALCAGLLGPGLLGPGLLRAGFLLVREPVGIGAGGHPRGLGGLPALGTQAEHPGGGCC